MNSTEILLRNMMLQNPQRIKQAFDYEVTTGKSTRLKHSTTVIDRINYILENYAYLIEDDLDDIPPSILIHYGEITKDECVDKVFIVHIQI